MFLARGRTMAAARRPNVSNAPFEVTTRGLRECAPAEARSDVDFGERQDFVPERMPSRAELFGVPQRRKR